MNVFTLLLMIALSPVLIMWFIARYYEMIYATDDYFWLGFCSIFDPTGSFYKVYKRKVRLSHEANR